MSSFSTFIPFINKLNKLCLKGGLVLKKLTNDHRTRVTKMLIRRAFTTLLKQKPIQSISITELCEEAGINRGTFYTHYTDIYDLRTQIEDEMLEDFKKALAPLAFIDKEQLTPVRVTTEVFQCLKDNSDLCTVTLGAYGDKTFALRLVNLGREICVEAYSEYFKRATPKQIEYFYAFASSGCIGLLQKWLADGMSTPAEEVARMAEAIMLYGVGFLSGAPEAK
ncbi:MAG: TetR/AcrR family transcriptional regulator C-terminal domain-containing protein [Oscillospiraceae bacterium]|nr:TetR/AcrR family transcriptional regulator C-terminal domain-containing protein [Oscillospiraceae bacterium]